MAERTQQRDRLPAAIERIIENHLPGGSAGVDVPGMARAIVRHVRRAEAADTAAALAESLCDHTRPAAPRPDRFSGGAEHRL